MNIKLPVGFHEFHENNLLNFQLNRFYCTGMIDYDSVVEAAKSIHDFSSFKESFLKLAETAEKKEDYKASAIFYRGAEFFALGDDPQRPMLYDRCIQAYNLAFADEPFIYEDIPYEGKYMHAMVMHARGQKKGTILFHGGYDSFMQEFYVYVLKFAESGYDVILFEGPGQGRTLNKHQLPMIYDWEKPVSAVLDYFQLEDVTLIGVSLGGYLAARAAAYEPRISRVVLYDLVYDLYDALFQKNRGLKRLVDISLKLNIKPVFDYLQWKINKNLFAKWLVLHGYFVVGVDNLQDYYRKIKKYNTKKVSGMIWQDVFVMAGEDDLYTPYLDRQMKALTSARSKKYRLYTRDEHASHHCQLGNVGLAISDIVDWIESVTHTSHI